MKRLVLVLAIAGCGGTAKSPRTPGGATTGLSECAVVAGHVADAVFTWKEPPPAKKDDVVHVITERCEQDQWTAAAKQCFGGISNEESARSCIDTLSKDQHDKVMNAMESKFDHGKMKHDEAGARAPAAAPPAQGADPCEGGE